jgi:hypothetical protein
MRNGIGKLVLTFAAIALMAGTSFADIVVGEFTLDESLNTVASRGEVTFSLNPNGTIDASVTSFVGGMHGFAFDWTVVEGPQSNFSPPPFQLSAIVTNFGAFNTGILYEIPDLPTSVTWTIGEPGDFNSVLEAFGGPAKVDFFLYTDTNGHPLQSGANAVLVTPPVPEPSGIVMLGLGGIGVGLAAWRRRRLA